MYPEKTSLRRTDPHEKELLGETWEGKPSPSQEQVQVPKEELTEGHRGHEIMEKR